MMKKRMTILSKIMSMAMVMSLVPTTAFAGSYIPKTYDGSATVYCDEDGDFDNYQISVSVPVNEDGTIGAFGITSYDESNASYVNKAMYGKKTAGVVDQLAGKTVSEVLSMSSVDTVSGATCTSEALLLAVQNALANVEMLDTSMLEEAIAAAEALNESDYTKESWALMQTALEEARAALSSGGSQETVSGAASALNDAVAALQQAASDPDPENPDEKKEEEEKDQKDPDEKEEETVTKKDMTSVSVGGVNYYYVNTKDDADDTVYLVTVTSGRGPSAVTKTTEYKKAELTQLASSDYYYTVAPEATALSGTLYGSEEGSGTMTSYSGIYSGMGALAADPAYDCVSSATGYSGYHAKDISETVVFGTDAEGKKAITGLELGRKPLTVDAVSYVEASILKAAGEMLTEEEQSVLSIKLKANPMTAPSEGVVQVSGTASWTTSRYGDGEFAIVPDETAEGYVWSEYWNKVYAATVSDGTTTVGAVHWIDLYGEAAVSGPHYNKVELALNNGTSVGANGAAVSRYAAFYDADTGSVKPGTYTITIYADGYSDLVTSVEIPAPEEEEVVQPTDKEPTEEKPSEGQPTDKEPTEEQPTEEKPSDQKKEEEKLSAGAVAGSGTSGGNSTGGSISGGSASAGKGYSGTAAGSAYSGKTTVGSKAVNTGDTTSVTLWASLFTAAAAVLGLLGFRRRKTK